MLMRAATVVQVLQDLFQVLLHVVFYLWSLLNFRLNLFSVKLLVSGLYYCFECSGGSSYGRTGRPPPLNDHNLGLVMAARNWSWRLETVCHRGKFSLKFLILATFCIKINKKLSASKLPDSPFGKSWIRHFLGATQRILIWFTDYNYMMICRHPS